MTTPTIDPISIEVSYTTYAFTEGMDRDGILDVDIEDSIERMLEILADELRDYYPDASITVEVTSEMRSATVKVYTEFPETSNRDDWDYEVDVRESRDAVESAVQEILHAIYNEGSFWVVGFNADAWTDEVGVQADKADTGDVLTIKIADAGPMETQDAIVEIVVLDGTDQVAYRYSTHSHDDKWQLGTVEDAVSHAADCYAALNEIDA